MPRMTQQEAQALWEREQAKEAARIQAEEAARNLAYQSAAERSGFTGPTQAPPEGWQPPTEAIEPSWSPIEEIATLGAGSLARRGGESLLRAASKGLGRESSGAVARRQATDAVIESERRRTAALVRDMHLGNRDAMGMMIQRSGGAMARPSLAAIERARSVEGPAGAAMRSYLKQHSPRKVLHSDESFAGALRSGQEAARRGASQSAGRVAPARVPQGGLETRGARSAGPDPAWRNRANWEADARKMRLSVGREAAEDAAFMEMRRGGYTPEAARRAAQRRTEKGYRVESEKAFAQQQAAPPLPRPAPGTRIKSPGPGVRKLTDAEKELMRKNAEMYRREAGRLFNPLLDRGYKSGEVQRLLDKGWSIDDIEKMYEIAVFKQQYYVGAAKRAQAPRPATTADLDKLTSPAPPRGQYSRDDWGSQADRQGFHQVRRTGAPVPQSVPAYSDPLLTGPYGRSGRWGPANKDRVKEPFDWRDLD